MSRREVIGVAIAGVLGVALGCEAIKSVVPPGSEASRMLGTAERGMGLLASVKLTPEDEREIGRGVSANLLARYPLLDDAATTRYVNLVGALVASQSDQPDWNWRFAVLETAEVNAFSTPGGFVYVTRGALLLMQNEAELAGVLGHEVAHVALRHGAETVEGDNLKKFGVFAGETASGYKMTDSAFGGIVDSLTDGLLFKPRDRGQEIEADRVGERYAAAAGYYPFGLRDFLVQLKDRGRADDSAFKAMFATHPTPQDRLNEIAKAISEDGLADSGQPRLPERLRRSLRL